MKKPKIIDFDKPIVCSIESFVDKDSAKVEIIDEKKCIVEARLAELGTVSRNRCFYGIDEVMSGLKESRFVQENLSQGTWFGELEHPPRNCDMRRFMKIEDDRISHSIRKYSFDGTFIKGIVQFIEPWGPKVWNWITEADANLAFSLRIYTPNYVEKSDQNGKYIVKTKPMYPVTFDCVKTPGYRRCRITDPDEFAANNKLYQDSGRSVGQEDLDYMYEGFESIDWIIANPKNQIKEILEGYGEESNVVEDLFNFDIKKAKAVLHDFNTKVTFSTEDGTDITMHVNPYIFNDIMTHGRTK